MREEIRSKVCIIGAGPAGATTSLFLSKFQVPHIIIDGATFPRDKVCGDGLDLKVMWVLNNLDPSIIENDMMNSPDFSKAKGCSIIVAKDKKYTLGVKKAIGDQEPYPYFFVAKRSAFDNLLVSKLPSPFADFRPATEVHKIERTKDGWIIFAKKDKVDVEIHTRLLIGADGDHSIVLRTLGERKIERSNYAAAIRQYWKGIDGFDEDANIEIYLPKHLPLAYFWMFPLPNGEANVGCGLASDFVSAKSVNLKKVLNDIITNDPIIKDRFKNAEPLEKPVGWGIPLASQKRKACGDGYLLVGDAASLACPTTGEGIGPSMLSSFVAANFIKKAVEQDCYRHELFKNYDREISYRLEIQVKIYKILRKISPVLFNVLINFFSASQFAQFYYKREMKKWLDTTKNKKIKLSI